MKRISQYKVFRSLPDLRGNTLDLLSQETQLLQDSEHPAEQAQERRLHIEAIHRISKCLQHAQDLKELLARLVAETLGVLDAAAVTLWLYNPAKDELYLAAASGFPNLTVRLKPGQGIAGQAFLTGEPYVSQEFKNDPRTHESARVQVPAGLGGAAVPISSGSSTVGVLFASVLFPRRFSADQIQLLTIVSDLAGIAIQRMQEREGTQLQMQHLAELWLVETTLSSSLDLPVILDTLVHQLVIRLQVDAAAILFFNPQKQMLEYAAGHGFRTAPIERKDIKVGEGPEGESAKERHPICLHKGTPEWTTHGMVSKLTGDQFAGCCLVPLVAQGQLHGVLELYYREPLATDWDSPNWIERLANQAAQSIQNALHCQDLEALNTELTLAYDTTLEAWARLIDRQTNEPEGHSQFLAEQTVQLARSMGLPENQLTHLKRGALLHDIGMMRIPESIRLKPGALSTEEWETLCLHPIYGYDLLSAIPFLRPALQIPYCHHEKWDGTGYPNRLGGETIPIAARIFAVLDVWDALRSDRPYRPGWPERKVLERLRSLAGKHLDPDVVQVFLDQRHEDSGSMVVAPSVPVDRMAQFGS